MEKKLCKVEDGKMLFGVCNGVAKYFGVDPTVIRLFWVFSRFFYGLGELAYLIAVIVLPTEDFVKKSDQKDTRNQE